MDNNKLLTNIELIKKEGLANGSLKMLTSLDDEIRQLNSLRFMNAIIHSSLELDNLLKSYKFSEEDIESVSVSERKDEDYGEYFFKLEFQLKDKNLEKKRYLDLTDLKDEAFEVLSIVGNSNLPLISSAISDKINLVGYGKFEVNGDFKSSFIKAMLNDELYANYNFMTLTASIDSSNKNSSSSSKPKI